MSNFSSVLTELMERKGSVNNEVIRRSGINRSTFFKIKKGLRHPSGREMVDKITDALRLTDEHRRLLVEAYEIDKMGAYRYYGMQEVRHFFMEEVRLSEEPPVLVTIPAFQKNERVRIFRDVSEVKSAVSGMLYEGSSKIRIIEAHMNSLCAEVIPQASQIHPDTEFIHIFAMDDTDAVGLDHRLYNMSCFHNVMDILIRTARYSPKYFYVPVSAIGRSNRQLNFILSDRFLLTYNDELDSAVLYENPELLELYGDIFEDYNNHSVCLTEMMSLSDFQRYQTERNMEEGESAENVYCFYPGLCSTLVFEDDKEIMSRYIGEGNSKKEEHIRYWADIGEEFRRFLEKYGEKCHIVSASNAIESFARTGFVNDLPRYAANALKEEERAAVLRSWRKKAVSYNVQTLRQKCIPDTSSLAVIALPRGIYIVFYSEPRGQVVQICIKEPSIVGLMYEYLAMLEEEYAMERDEYTRFMDDLIVEMSS